MKALHFGIGKSLTEGNEENRGKYRKNQSGHPVGPAATVDKISFHQLLQGLGEFAAAYAKGRLMLCQQAHGVKVCLGKE